MENKIELPKRVKKTTCEDCGIILTETNRYPSCIKHYQYCCKKCWNQRFYFAVRKGRYGLNKADIKIMLDKQNEECAICYSKLTMSFCVDHNHKTNKVRGLLCTNCNTGLGMFKDSINLLKNAREYMRKHK